MYPILDTRVEFKVYNGSSIHAITPYSNLDRLEFKVITESGIQMTNIIRI